MHSPCFTPHAIASARPPCAPTDHPSSASSLCDLARPPVPGAVGQLGPAAALVGVVGGLGRQRVPCVGRGVVGGRGLGRGGHDLGRACVVRGSAVADAIATVRASQALVTTKDAFELLVLTAARSGEVRLATWDEVDLDAAVWTIPAARMKAKRDHRVPLSGRALAILHDARRRSDGTGLVFRSPRGKPLSDMTLSKLIKELGIAAVPHGFRSSFRDWAAERTNTPREVVEAGLAHTVRNPTEAAYARSDLFERRRRLMDDWAVYLAGLTAQKAVGLRP